MLSHINLTLAKELGCLRAAAKMFLFMFVGILRAPCEFFDTIPKGRILDRCSSDLYTLDSVMGQNIRVLIMTVSRVGLSFALLYCLCGLLITTDAAAKFSYFLLCVCLYVSLCFAPFCE